MVEQRRYKIVVADDHPIVLDGLGFLLSKREEFIVAASCLNGSSALTEIRRIDPDLAVLDVNMPDLSGIQVLQNIEAEGIRTRVVLLTASLTDAQAMRAVDLGVWGMVLKESAAYDLIRCLQNVVSGKRQIPDFLLNPSLERRGESPFNARGHLLTSREREITLLVSAGLSNKEIARKLVLTEGTVKVHLHNIYQKLEISNRASLASLAARAAAI